MKFTGEGPQFTPVDEDLELPDNPPTLVEIVRIDEIWPQIQRYLDGLDTWGERAAARRILIGRLKHPELGGNPQYDRGTVHPRQSGAGRQRSTASCARCGSPRGYHDIDGQHDGCDGYVEAR